MMPFTARIWICRLVLTLVGGTGCATASYARSDEVYFSKIGIEQGLSQLSVMNIYQDELGTMWFGTREGVNLYNGSSMTVLQPKEDDPHSLSGNLIKMICGDGNGSVFIQTQNGIDRFDLRTRTLSRVTDTPYDAMAYDTDRLLLAAQNRIFSYRDGKFSLLLEIGRTQTVITRIHTGTNGRLRIGTVDSGVYTVGADGQARPLITGCSRVSSIYEDSRQNLWIATWQNGLYRITPHGTVVNYRESADGRALSSNFVRTVCEDNSGGIWIGTKNGLDRFDTVTEQFTHYDSEEHNLQKLSNESVWDLYKDRQGTIWAGTYFGGVNYFNPEHDFYTFHDLQKGVLRNKPFPVISRVIEAEDGRLFLCTEGNGLLSYDPSEKTYTDYAALRQKNIKTAYYDRTRRQLWLGLHLEGLCMLDTKTQQVTFYRKINAGLYESNIVRAILPYRDLLLVATYNGLYLFDPHTKQFSIFSEALHRLATYFIDVQSDYDGQLWIAGYGLYRYDLRTGICRSYTHRKDNPSSLSNNQINKILIDRKRNVWIATNGGGVNLYNPSSDSFTRFDSDNGSLPNAYISNLTELPSGKLLLATTQGFSTLDPSTHEIDHYGPGSGFPLNSLYNGGLTVTADNEVYIAGMNGMVSFAEDKLAGNLPPFTLHFSQLWVNHLPVLPGDDSGILNVALPFTESVALNHKQSMLEIEFSSDHFIASNRPGFRYRLLGLSEQWMPVQPGAHRFNFTGIHPGRYRLELEAVSPIDGTVLARTALKLNMAPPFYKTWYAYLTYALLLALLAVLYVRFVQSRVRLVASLEYQKKEKEHLEAVNQSKLRFFTNITHEFRTPLTIIASQVDTIMQTGKTSAAVHRRMASVRRNIGLMQNLINELMEFRKAENGKLVIRASEHDIVKFMHEMYLAFEEYAEHRQIDFTFHADRESIPLWFDPAQMQKVFYNLLSNAFKYTSAGGKIGMTVNEHADEVRIAVHDSGQGIRETDIPHIFDRFYQAIDTGLKTDESVSPGTGIGLALTKHIADAHGARMLVSSRIDEGSVFEVVMKKGAGHLSDEQKRERPESGEWHIRSVEVYDAPPDTPYPDETAESVHTLPSILIVEDNPELLHVLQSIFEPIYTVHTASNGEEGLRKTIRHQPDIVLSDLMMPVLSGNEMCLRIKNNFATSHIPVVLLTAQTAVEAKLDSLRLGADDYITKPFDVKLLIARCRNLIDGRRRLQEKFGRSTELPPSAIASNDIDREFIERARQVIEQHLANEDFDVALFSREMALGRTRLFHKIKGVTGQTPNEFIQTIRMKKATGLLQNHPEMNIADVAYNVGFGSPKYFSKCFREQFGMSPSEFRARPPAPHSTEKKG